jgi:hypothetical protein
MKQEDMEVGREYVNKGMCKLHYQGRMGNSQAGRFKDQHGDYHNMRYDRMEEAPKYPNQPLPNCEERIAHARGANIEVLIKGEWILCDFPPWSDYRSYRVKVEKTRDELRIEELYERVQILISELNDINEEIAELEKIND